MSAPTSTEIVNKAQEILEQEGIHNESTNLSGIERIEKLILPALENSKNIQSSLYSFQPTPGSGVTRKIKNLIYIKIRNITVAVLERTIMRQQKVNELNYQALQAIAAELAELKKSQSNK